MPTKNGKIEKSDAHTYMYVYIYQMEILKLKKWGKNKIKIESMSSIAKDKE